MSELEIDFGEEEECLDQKRSFDTPTYKKQSSNKRGETSSHVSSNFNLNKNNDKILYHFQKHDTLYNNVGNSKKQQ